MRGQSQGFIFTYCNAQSLGLSKAKNKTQRKTPSLPLENHGKNRISAMICKWEVSQQSNFPWLSRASNCTWKPTSSLLFPSGNTDSFNSLWNSGVSFEQSPLRLRPWGWESSELCWNSPVQSKVTCLPRIYQDSANDLENLLNDSIQSFGPITHGFDLL